MKSKLDLEQEDEYGQDDRPQWLLHLNIFRFVIQQHDQSCSQLSKELRRNSVGPVVKKLTWVSTPPVLAFWTTRSSTAPIARSSRSTTLRGRRGTLKAHVNFDNFGPDGGRKILRISLDSSAWAEDHASSVKQSLTESLLFTGAPAFPEATEKGAVREDEQHPAAPQLVSNLRSIFEFYHVFSKFEFSPISQSNFLRNILF